MAGKGYSSQTPPPHGTHQPVSPRCQSAFPQFNPPGVCNCLCGQRELGGGRSPARMPSPRPLAHPALPHPKAARLSLLTLPFGSCSFGLAAALILAIPWKESFSITQLAAKPSACQLCLLTCVAGVPQQHTPAPARPGLPVPAFCTPMPHTRLPSTPWHVSSRRSRIPSCHGWSGCPGPATPAQLHGHPFGFCLVRSRRARHKRTPVLFDLEIPPPPPACATAHRH